MGVEPPGASGGIYNEFDVVPVGVIATLNGEKPDVVEGMNLTSSLPG